jgi:hypothetical protein
VQGPVDRDTNLEVLLGLQNFGKSFTRFDTQSITAQSDLLYIFVGFEGGDVGFDVGLDESRVSDKCMSDEINYYLRPHRASEVCRRRT